MAQETIEMVRFTIKPGAEEALVDERPAMVEAVRAEFPGMLSAHLAKLDETTWLELIVWTSREAAQRATEKAHDIPAVQFVAPRRVYEGLRQAAPDLL